MHVGQPGQVTEALLQFFGDLLIGSAVATLHLQIDFCRNAKVQDLRDQISGLELELNVGEGNRQLAAQQLDIVRRRGMTLLQLQQDLTVIDADHRAIAARLLIDKGHELVLHGVKQGSKS
jgi:hypothetical protein